MKIYTRQTICLRFCSIGNYRLGGASFSLRLFHASLGVTCSSKSRRMTTRSAGSHCEETMSVMRKIQFLLVMFIITRRSCPRSWSGIDKLPITDRIEIELPNVTNH